MEIWTFRGVGDGQVVPGYIGVVRTGSIAPSLGGDRDARSLSGRGRVWVGSECQAHELIDGEGQDTEHQVARRPCHGLAPGRGGRRRRLASAVHPFDGGPLYALRVAVSGAALGPNLPSPFLLPVLVPAGVDVSAWKEDRILDEQRLSVAMSLIRNNSTYLTDQE